MPNSTSVTVIKPDKLSRKQKLEAIGNTGQRLAVVIWLGLDAYFLYAFCYQILWLTIQPSHFKSAIAVLVIFLWFNFVAFASWIAIQVYGPGVVNQKYPTSKDPQTTFICNQQGYSLYCSYCDHVKPNRTHHSAFTDTCIPCMDHFCPWVGHVIGQNNLKFFLQFSWSTAIGLIIVLVTLLVFQHRPLPNMNGHSIALYILCGMFLSFLVALNGQHIYYILCGHTTVEYMNMKRGQDMFVNYYFGNGIRKVALVRPEDLKPVNKLFTRGWLNNVREVMGPIWTWALPIHPQLREPQISESYVEELRRREIEMEKIRNEDDSDNEIENDIRDENGNENRNDDEGDPGLVDENDYTVNYTNDMEAETINEKF